MDGSALMAAAEPSGARAFACVCRGDGTSDAEIMLRVKSAINRRLLSGAEVPASAGEILCTAWPYTAAAEDFGAGSFLACVPVRARTY